jgi:hypothetical protein
MRSAFHPPAQRNASHCRHDVVSIVHSIAGYKPPWLGPWRSLALVYAAIFAVAFYGIYRRYPLVWKLGFVSVVSECGTVYFSGLVDALAQPYGWVGATAVTLFAPFVALYLAN